MTQKAVAALVSDRCFTRNDVSKVPVDEVAQIAPGYPPKGPVLLLYRRHRNWKDATGEWVHVTITTVFGQSMEVRSLHGQVTCAGKSISVVDFFLNANVDCTTFQ